MPKPLTDEDVLKVSIATKRESYTHRRWPHDVVRAFASGGVIAASRGRHDSASHPVTRRLARIRSRIRLAHFNVRGKGAKTLSL